VLVCAVLPMGGRYACPVMPLFAGAMVVRPQTAHWCGKKDYLRRAALADLGCAVLGVVAAVQLRFGDDATGLTSG
jgi:hypothetical protein